MPCALFSIILCSYRSTIATPQRAQDHQHRPGWDSARTLRFFCFGVGLSMYSAFDLEINLEPAVSEALYWAGGTFFSNASFLFVGGAPTGSVSSPYQKGLRQINLLCEFAVIHRALLPSDYCIC